MQDKKREKIIKMVLTVVVVFILLWFAMINPMIKFKNQEKIMLNSAKRYFEINTSKLPTGNKVRKISLDTLYSKDYISDDLKSPYTNKMCNSKDSFVRVKKVNGKYKYNIYLECGIFKSRIDHKGPVINLKGEDQITIYLGDEYKELGVESVIDDTDGKLDKKDVVIDSSKLNLNRVGTYEILYTITDSLDNKTVKKRVVNVTQTLNNIVSKDTDKTKMYKGNISNNYLKIDGILFKIVGINKDKTVKVVSESVLGSVNYNGLYSWLNNYFYESLSNSAKKHIYFDSKWCNDKVINFNKNYKCDSYTKKQPVGLLSINDYYNSKDENGISNLYNDKVVWTYNYVNSKEAIVNSYYDISKFEAVEFKNVSKDLAIGVKPALNIKENAVIISGNGSNTDPYILKGNETKLKSGEKINKAVTGSYIKYSGYNFRVINKNDDDLLKVIMVDPLTSYEGAVYYNYDNELVSYNPNRKTNIGFKINNKASSYIKNNYFDFAETVVKKYNDNILYNGAKSSEKYKVKFSLASIFDLYSAETTNGVSTWYKETSNENNCFNSSTVGIVCQKFDINETNGIKLVGYLNKNVVVKSGDGSKSNPFMLTK